MTPRAPGIDAATLTASFVGLLIGIGLPCGIIFGTH